MRDYLYNLATDNYRGFIPGLVKAFLFILSIIYGLLARILILFYRLKAICRLNCKVISVGNLTWGGTGKTTVVEYIARYLKGQGRKVAILSRGYRKNPKSKIQNPKLDYASMGDEPLMLSEKLGDIPVIADANRIRAAKKAINEYCVDTVILDDGLQQWRIKKDLEIVCIDATDPFGNTHLIPRGILREPLSALKRADIFILTKANLNPDTGDIKDFLIQKNPRALIIESIHNPLGFYRIDQAGELLDKDILKGKSVTLFSGIGDPDAFENLIANLGIQVGLSFRFCDHYHYRQQDLEKIIRESQKRNIRTLITTEKDAVRLRSLPLAACRLELLVLRIELRISKDEQGFHHRLLGLYRL